MPVGLCHGNSVIEMSAYGMLFFGGKCSVHSCVLVKTCDFSVRKCFLVSLTAVHLCYN